MTVRDREVLELLREEPELLAIADAVSENERVPRRSRRRRRMVASVAVGAAALLAFALLSPWESRNEPGLLERALAAVPDHGPVLHTVFVSSGGFESVGPEPSLRLNLRTGRLRPLEDRAEVWYDRERRLVRWIVSRDSHVLDEGVASGVEHPLGSYFQETEYYRDALEQGKATIVGEGRWRGRAVHWLKLEGVPGGPGFHFGIDRDTYQLLVLRPLDDRGRATGRETGLLLIEYAPRTKGQFRGPPPKLITGGPVAGWDPNGVPLARARDALGVRALWVGPSIEGLPFRRALVAEACPPQGPCPPGKSPTGPERLRLVYTSGELSPGGLHRGGTKFVEIEEVRAGTSLGRFPPGTASAPPPEGFVDLTSVSFGFGIEENMQGRRQIPAHTVWAADLSAGKVWVRITASSRELAIAAARALRPIPASA
jgi:hypothetical protein